MAPLAGGLRHRGRRRTAAHEHLDIMAMALILGMLVAIWACVAARTPRALTVLAEVMGGTVQGRQAAGVHDGVAVRAGIGHVLAFGSWIGRRPSRARCRPAIRSRCTWPR